MANSAGGPAFPRSVTVQDAEGLKAEAFNGGMTLRDYFAAKAMQALIASPRMVDGDPKFFEYDDTSTHAYAYADAMITERSKS